MNKLEEVIRKHEQILYPTVRVTSNGSGGSGTVLYSGKDKDGKCVTMVITNYHVVEDSVEVRKEVWNSKLTMDTKMEYRKTVSVDTFKYNDYSHKIGANIIEGDIVAYDSDQDMALIKLRDKENIYPYVANIIPRDKYTDVHIFDEVICCGAALGHPPLPTDGFIGGLDDEFDNYKYGLCTAASIYGNCIPGDSYVTMYNNDAKFIKDINIGETVLSIGKKGLRHSRVLDVVKSGYKDVYNIKTRSRTLRASGNHPILSITTVKDFTGKNQNVIVWKEVDDLEVGDVVGILSGVDERSYPANALMNINIGNTEYDKGLATTIDSLGFNKKSTEKSIPRWVMTLPYSYKMAFIEGYLESNGYINPHGAMVFEASSKSLIYKLRLMLIGIGYRVTNIYYRLRSNGNICGREFSTSGSWSFQCYPNSIHSESTKLGKLDKINGIAFETITSIDYDGHVMTYDLKLDESHNFFADGICVHNSGGSLFRYSDERDRYEYIGIPSGGPVILNGYGEVAVTFIGYFIPADRILNFLEYHCYQFIYDNKVTIEECDSMRDKSKKRARRDASKNTGGGTDEE